jgi:acyl-CoA synthetase (NDP forming)
MAPGIFMRSDFSMNAPVGRPNHMHDFDLLFNPRSIAIIGASSDRTKLGGRPVHYLKSFGFRGAIYPINPGSSEIQGLPAYASIADVPGEIDQAIILVPAAMVEAALIDCAHKRVKIVQILSSGFAESGAEGRAAQDRLVSIARGAGLRLTGPNALGAVSPSNGLFATFSSALAADMAPRAGDIAVTTQSGAFGSCAYVMASLRGLGLSRVIATGNEADIDVAESISFLAQDPETRVICAAIESCRDGMRLRAALRDAAKARKPVIIMKVGTTQVGALAAATHTGALAGNDAVYDTVFRECGAWRAKSIEEMIDIASLFSIGGMPGNNRIGILTVSGGIGILMADAAVDTGLAVDPLPSELLARLRIIVPFATGNNPFDTTAQIVKQRTAITQVGAEILDATGFGTIAFYLANNGLAPKVFGPTQEALVALKKRFPDRLLIAVMPSEASVRTALEQAGIAVFEDPSRAIHAAAAASQIGRIWETLEEPTTLDRPRTPILARRGEAGAKALLSSAGIPVLDERVCQSAEQAGQAADEIGYPVVAKILSPDILHKTEIGGVTLNLSNRTAVEAAHNTMVARARSAFPHAAIEGTLIAPMIKGGLETILGVHRDPTFGPMIMFGLGGVMVELFKDVGFASAPLSRRAAERLIDSAKGSRLLQGWRGSPALDRRALVDALCHLGDLAASTDEITGVDVNPFLVRASGAVALDAAITMRATT